MCPDFAQDCRIANQLKAQLVGMIARDVDRPGFSCLFLKPVFLWVRVFNQVLDGLDRGLLNFVGLLLEQRHELVAVSNFLDRVRAGHYDNMASNMASISSDANALLNCLGEASISCSPMFQRRVLSALCRSAACAMDSV